MAEVLSKTSLVSSCNGDKQQHCRRISVVPKTSNFPFGVPCAARSFLSLKLKCQVLGSSSLSSPSSASDTNGKKFVFHVNEGIPSIGNPFFRSSTAAQRNPGIGKAQKWWEKGLQPNMREVTSAEDLVDSLLNAGDKLVVVDFFSPGCGGCRALHPKVCQLAEMNPDVQFLQVNNEEHKSMCYSLGVHVLPFFRFYRGAHGRLCSFSCTNASIKKFKDALAKHTPDRCSIGPTKGLEEEELLALSADEDLSFTYTPKPVQSVPPLAQEELEAEATPDPPCSALLHLPSRSPRSFEVPKERNLISCAR